MKHGGRVRAGNHRAEGQAAKGTPTARCHEPSRNNPLERTAQKARRVQIPATASGQTLHPRLLLRCKASCHRIRSMGGATAQMRAKKTKRVRRICNHRGSRPCGCRPRSYLRKLNLRTRGSCRFARHALRGRSDHLRVSLHHRLQRWSPSPFRVGLQRRNAKETWDGAVPHIAITIIRLRAFCF